MKGLLTDVLVQVKKEQLSSSSFINLDISQIPKVLDRIFLKFNL